ncbi:MAG: hypothetical protein NWF14_01660 [Candidatus Bathyarchaeota archaeon]|nr:hypothetical protein [Candidatus Bathyarchaeota archaeon]
MDVATISTVIAAISVVVGVIFAILQMRDATKTRKTGLIIQLNPSLNISHNEFVEAQSKLLSLEYENYDDFKKKHGEIMSAGEAQKAIQVMGGYFEGMGFLLHRQLIDVGIVDYVTGGVEGVKMLWDKLKPILEGYKKEYNLQKIPFQWTEYLYNELQKREQTLPQTQQ